VTDRLVLTGLRGQGRHGVFAEERDTPRPFVADLVLHVDLARAAETDELAGTVDYGGLATRVVERIEGDPVNLIETLAAGIARDCLADPRVHTAEVTVHKPQAPITVEFEDVAVTIVRSRS